VRRDTCTAASTNANHPLYGFDFIHTELSPDAGWAPAGFAAFVSSIIESGADPARMDAVRARLRRARSRALRLPCPGLMDFIATKVAKASRVQQREYA
jgi:S-(hydroxymethyl)glutathione synthase